MHAISQSDVKITADSIPDLLERDRRCREVDAALAVKMLKLSNILRNRSLQGAEKAEASSHALERDLEERKMLATGACASASPALCDSISCSHLSNPIKVFPAGHPYSRFERSCFIFLCAAGVMDMESAVTTKAEDVEFKYAEEFKIHAARILVDVMHKIHKEVIVALMKADLKRYFK